MSSNKMKSSRAPKILKRAKMEPLAYHSIEGSSPTIIFLGGLMSDMSGTKATTLENHCKAEGKAFIRFDYTGHGASGGKFKNSNISDWHKDTLSIIDHVSSGPIVLVGSSMGGWQMLLAAKERPERVIGLVGIAAAPDFTEDLMWNTFSTQLRNQIANYGYKEVPSKYDDSSYPISFNLIEDGRKNLVLREKIPFIGPVRLLHGMCDVEVPWETSVKISACLSSTNVITTLIKDGDHRLSEPKNLELLNQIVSEVSSIQGNIA